MDADKRKEMLKKVQQRLQNEKSSSRDPNQFKPVNVKQGDPAVKYRFVILPGLIKGDKCADGVASETMGGRDPKSKDPYDRMMETPFCVKGGQHWIQGRPYSCPRLCDGSSCPWCELGFELRNQTDVEEERRNISKLYLPRPIFAVNIYFPPLKTNPSELHNKVFWYTMPKTAFDKMEECLMRNGPGDDLEEPEPWGLFYDPEDCLVFQLEVTHKGGYNNYENSRFLSKRSSIAESDDEIKAILAKRYDVSTKFPAPDVRTLQELLSKIAKGGSATKSSNRDDDEDGMPASRKSQESTKEDKEPTKETKPAKEVKESTKTKRIADDDDELPASKKNQESPKKEPPTSSVDDIDDPELKKLLGEVKEEL